MMKIIIIMKEFKVSGLYDLMILDLTLKLNELYKVDKIIIIY